MTGAAIIDDTRAMLALFVRSACRDLHLRTGGYEMFFARPDAAPNPMALVADARNTVAAPHLGLFYARIAPGAAVSDDSVIGQLEVLGEREDIRAGHAGRIAAVLVEDGALVEYATPLVRIASAN